MAYINQREVREQRRRRKNALLGIFLLIPLVFAGYFYFIISTKTLNAETTEKIQLTYGEEANTVVVTERADIAVCMNAILNAKTIEENVSRPLSEYTEVKALCSDQYTSLSCKFYFSDSAADTLMVNQDGTLHVVEAADASKLMLSAPFTFLYQTAPAALQMNIANQFYTVAPSYTWHYILADGTERETSDTPAVQEFSAKGEIPVFTMAGDPDETKLIVTIGNEVKTGSIGSLESFLPKGSSRAEICISASWTNPAADGYYGTAEYRFILNYDAEA